MAPKLVEALVSHFKTPPMYEGFRLSRKRSGFRCVGVIQIVTLKQAKGNKGVEEIARRSRVQAETRLILRSQGGFEARAFTLPLDALEAAQLYAPDLLISDVVMPALSGIDLAIQVRQHCPDCKVLLFSGQAATAGLLEAARANGYNFEILLKPVHPSDLLEKIRNLTEPDSSTAWAEVSRAEVGGPIKVQ